jgi:hypothetical protein
MVLGEVIAVEAVPIIGFEKREPIGLELAERHTGVVHVVEDTELHRAPEVEWATLASADRGAPSRAARD